MAVTANILDRNGVIEYVGRNAHRYNLDAAAVLAVANHEGLNTAPGSHWTVGGESNISFGPPSWFGNGAGSTLLQQFGMNAPAWSWTPQGIDYWLKSVADAGAAGLSGSAAIDAVVRKFERPRADLVAGEVSNATHDYGSFQTQISNLIGGITTPVPIPGKGTIPIPGNDQAEPVPGAGNAIVPVPPVGSAGINAGAIGPWPINIPSGLVLALLGVFLLLLGAMLFGFNVKARAQSVTKSAVAGDL